MTPDDAVMAQETPEARFGAQLRRLRVHAGLSVRALAEQLHRAHSGIVEFESGRRLPAVDVVEQYEDRFGLARGTLVAQRERARAERLELPRDGTVESHFAEIACPYKGLRTFEHDDAPLFFGREAQIQRVRTRLAEVRFVAVVGASGSGKSSFVRAGLLAGIERRVNGAGRCRTVLLTPGADPVDALASGVAAATGRGARELAADLRADPDALQHAARHAGGAGIVIAVDQFEELFTHCQDEGTRRCFVDALIAAWRDPASPFVVILALRADFYGRIAAYPDLVTAVVAHQTVLGPMSVTDLRRAIELPAAQTGLLLQPGLVATMLEDIADEPGALPLLSHALLETWKRRRGLMLTLAGYRDAGGVRGAIAQTAEQTLQTLPEADRPIARSIFLSLTHVGEGAEPTRRRVDRAELATHAQRGDGVDRVLGILADARLVTVDEHSVVVSHEALIRHWPRLRGWIDADRAALLIQRRLSRAAREWDTLHREPGALYRGARLATAREWAADHADGLSPLERDFLTASQTSEHRDLEHARRRSRRLRVLATGLAALTTIVAALAVWALDQRGDARREARKATSLALASAASLVLDSRPDVALLLAFEGYRASPRAEARSSVLAALSRARDPGTLAILHGHTDAVSGVAFSRDGRTLASTSADRTIRLWDVRSRTPRGAPMNGHNGPVGGVSFSPRGGTVASAGADTTIRLWDVDSHTTLGTPMNDHNGPVGGVAFSRDGRTLASASADTTIRLWDAQRRTQLGAPLRGHSDTVTSVAFSPDGRTLASAGADHTIRLWDAQRRTPLGVPLRGHTNTVTSVAFSPDGHTLASTAEDTTIRLWDVGTYTQRGASLIAQDVLRAVAFSPDGRTLASASADHTIRLWNVDSQTPRGQALDKHERAVISLAFSPDGRTLASAGADHTIRLWDARALKPLGVPLTGHTGAVRSVAFTPDGRTLASVGNDRTVRLWENVLWHDLVELQAEVCNLVGTGLSRAEWAQYTAGIPHHRSCS
jgi:WD40 repeat protein/transcriptional regulator with XRE-family HTH domain